MALQATYTQFSAAPDLAALAPNASLHYITTTTSFANPAEIIKHLGNLRSHVKKIEEKVLSAVEGNNSLALALEIDTTLEFVVSGGPYLPGLDDNFLADRTVHVSITHIVTFDSNGKITQIRQTWDQGSLLKQLDIIGKSGRNWPIRDSADQIKLISRCVQGGAGADGPSQPSNSLPVRSRGNSTNPLRDPHATLDLFAPRADIESEPPAPVVSPYAGTTRPHQRSITEILGGSPEDDEDSSSPSRGRERASSPSKAGIAPRAGSSKNFQPMRLFEGAETADEPDSLKNNKSPERFYKPNPKKYEHFDFADGSDPQDAPAAGVAFDDVKTKHKSQWSFDDFNTPSKPRPRPTRSQEVRHWGIDRDDINETPVAAKPAVSKPRRDAEPHFEFRDDGPIGEPRPVGRPRGDAHNKGLGLYKNNVYDEDGSAASADGPDSRALGNITNLKGRHNTFDPHFGFSDESPRSAYPATSKAGENALPEDRKKVVKMMEPSWSAYDESPISQKENSHPAGRNARNGCDDRGIVISGDGMGGRKGANGRGWSLGDEDEPQTGIVTAGEGIGGRKGVSGRGWSIGHESDEEKTPRPIAGKKPGAVATTSSLWDL